VSPQAKQAGAGLTVAVTGPTGDIGKPFMRALGRSRDVKRIIGMARRPFDPAAHGWKKAEYRRGDITDRGSVEALVEGADVVVHLAFAIFGDHETTQQVNLEGSRNVFEATVAAGVPRLVYASSVAAYGFHEENPQPLTEDVPPRGTERHYYSRQKAELEALLDDLIAGTELEAYLFRPCIVAGPEAPTLIEEIPYVKLGEKVPGAVRRLFDVVPILKPVIPDPGVPFQLVHHDDVASAMVAGTLGRGRPGVYNLAGDGAITVKDLADALGWYAIPVPELAVDATAEVVARIPFAPAEASWIEAVRTPVLMGTGKARRELRWRPKYDALETLRETVESYRAERERAERAE
jgi:UDP-glucose 4-epimerase